MCDPCCPPLCLPMTCCPSPCDPCCPSPCDPCCPSPCDPCCPPMCRPKRCRSRELRGGILYTKCDCVKRNGLQLDCPRSECFGRPCCVTKPIPICCPSKFMWRYANVTMGKSAYNFPKKECCPKANGQCNPCVMDCCPEPSCC